MQNKNTTDAQAARLAAQIEALIDAQNKERWEELTGPVDDRPRRKANADMIGEVLRLTAWGGDTHS